MSVLLGTVFVASLLGSLHCIGMCGPFALLASVDPHKRTAALVPTVMYSLGRLLTYLVIGFVFGMLGLAINHGTSFTSWQQSATYVAGGLMIAVGVISLARQQGIRIKLPNAFTPLQKWLQYATRRTIELPPFARATTIGMLTSLMPCGWLYTFAITAAGTGSPVWGMVLMSTFWAGTVPIMTALVFGINRISQSFQKRLPFVMAVLVVLIGFYTIAHRAPVNLEGSANVASGVEELNQQVLEIDHSQLPCCSEDEP